MAKEFSETDWQNLRIQFTRCGRSIWPPNHVLSKQWFHNHVIDYTFWFFFQGNGQLFDSQGNVMPLGPGTCLFMKPGDQYHAKQSEGEAVGNTYFHIDLYLRGKKLQQKHWPQIPDYSEVINVQYFDQVSRTIVDLINHPFREKSERSVFHEAEAQMLFKSMLLSVLRNHEERIANRNNGISLHHEKKMSAVLAILHENPSRFRNAAEMAAFCGYSSSHFRSVCHTITGRNPSELLIQTRIERAKSMLLETEMPIGMIAEMLGYDNVFYFSRQFHSIAGMTASRFRESHTSG